MRQLTHDQECDDSDEARREYAKNQKDQSFPSPSGERGLNIEPDNDVKWIVRQMLDREQPVPPLHGAKDANRAVLFALQLVEDGSEGLTDNRIHARISR